MVGSLEEVSADCAGFLHLITKKLLDLCKSRPQFMYSKELYVSRLRIVMKVKVTQSCLTLCNPMDSSSQPLLSMESSRQEYLRKLPFPSPGDLPNPGLLHCRQIPYCLNHQGSPLLLSHFSRVQLCATPETAVHQPPLSLGFSRQEHRSGLPFPSPMHESEK